jgi:hypothetical protein
MQLANRRTCVISSGGLPQSITFRFKSILIKLTIHSATYDVGPRRRRAPQRYHLAEFGRMFRQSLFGLRYLNIFKDGAFEVKSRYVISWTLTFGLIILWFIPVAFVGLVSNLSSLCAKVPWLAWVCKREWF